MTIKILTLLISNLVFIHCVPKCCNDGNLELSSRECSNGKPIVISHCNSTYLIESDDNSTSILVDANNNLIIDEDYEDIIPEHDFCLTTLRDHREVYIICYEEEDVENSKSMLTVNLVLQLISVFFIILTVVVYLTTPPLLDLQGINIIHSISGLACGFLILAAINFSNRLDVAICHIVAYLLYTSFLYAFFWLNIISFHIWRQIVNPKILARFEMWKLVYYCYGLGGPLILLIFLVSVHHANSPHLKNIHPGIGQTSCWFKSPRETTIYFYGPISVLLVLNILYFIWTGIVLWQQAATRSNSKLLKYRVRLYIKLFFVMGLFWIFEVVQGIVHTKQGWYWFIMDIINSLEGVIIFLILVVFRKKVIRHLTNKSIFAKLNLPIKWRKVHDSECEEVEEDGVSMGSQFPPDRKETISSN